MWPDLFGPGWEIQLLMAAGLFTGIVAIFKAMAGGGVRSVQDPPDALQRLWHRYEEGDLTRQEFDRYRRQSASGALVGEVGSRRRIRYSLSVSQSMPGVTRVMKSTR
ncbi:MAG TPA: hypothetical protein VJT32_06420 [bacterium]|nr:hypothetical protein [bacterium]